MANIGEIIVNYQTFKQYVNLHNVLYGHLRKNTQIVLLMYTFPSCCSVFNSLKHIFAKWFCYTIKNKELC